MKIVILALFSPQMIDSKDIFLNAQSFKAKENWKGDNRDNILENEKQVDMHLLNWWT